MGISCLQMNELFCFSEWAYLFIPFRMFEELSRVPLAVGGLAKYLALAFGLVHDIGKDYGRNHVVRECFERFRWCLSYLSCLSQILVTCTCNKFSVPRLLIEQGRILIYSRARFRRHGQGPGPRIHQSIHRKSLCWNPTGFPSPFLSAPSLNLHPCDERSGPSPLQFTPFIYQHQGYRMWGKLRGVL